MIKSEFTIFERLIKENIPKESIIAIGNTVKNFTPRDWREIGSSLVEKELGALLGKIKQSPLQIKTLFQSIKKIPTLKYDEIYRETKILIPETSKKISEFLECISSDYQKLESDEERGKYVLKLILFVSAFVLSFQAGADFPYASKQKAFWAKSLMPILIVNVGLRVLDRLMEQIERKLNQADHHEVLKTITEIRNFINVINQGFSSGMTLQLVADGVADSSPKTKVDKLVYASVFKLFSKMDDKSDS